MWQILKHLVNCCQKSNASLNHPNPNIFDRSQWCPEGRVSHWYVAYRVVLVMMWPLIFLPLTWEKLSRSKGMGRIFLYATNLGIMLLFVHYLVDAGLVIKRWIWERKIKNKNGTYHLEPKLSWAYKLSWCLGTTVFDLALLISMIYWSILHNLLLKANLLTGSKYAISFVAHGLNSISLFIDIFVP